MDNSLEEDCDLSRVKMETNESYNESDGKGDRRSNIHGSTDMPQLSTTTTALEYNMKHRNRGTLLLFNQKTFDPRLGLNARSGTDADRDSMKSLFQKLGFRVNHFDDLDYWRLKRVLEEEAKRDHTDEDCFACVILTHGDEGFLYAKDAKFQTSMIWSNFLGDVCPSLAGKPKLFFIQACQGDSVDDGVHVIAPDAYQVLKIPAHADFLIACSTVPGYYSWRNTTEGSWFIQALHQVLSKHHEFVDVLGMMTLVNYTVAYTFQSNCSDPKMTAKKQIPYICSMLTRNLYLRSK